jgi:hypothetical protein
MATSRNKPAKRPKERCDDCPVIKEKKLPLVDRTSVRGMVDLKFPGIEATFPGTNRSVMVIIVAGICALVIIVPVCFYQVFSADPEALERVGEILSSDSKPREPVKMQVQTDYGIETIEVCPPCQDWSLDQCEERYGAYECPDCQCPQCPQCPAPIQAPIPPAMAPLLPPRKGNDLF